MDCMLRYVNWLVSLIDHAVFRSDQQFVGTDARQLVFLAERVPRLVSECWVGFIVN